MRAWGFSPFPCLKGHPPLPFTPWKVPLTSRHGASPLLPQLPGQGAPAPGPFSPSARRRCPPAPRRAGLRARQPLSSPLLPAAALTLCIKGWREGGLSLPLFPSPPAQAPAAGTDPSLPSCSSPPYLLSSPPLPPTRRETLPARRHGNTRHRQGSPAPPSPSLPPSRRPPCCGADRARPRPAPGKACPLPPGGAGL